MAIKANLVVDQGVDYYTTVTLTDDNGDVVNLGSYDITSQMRKTYTSSNAVVSLQPKKLIMASLHYH